MRASLLLSSLAVALCVIGLGGASAQDADRNQEVRELQEPAPEAERLELTAPAAAEVADDPVVEETPETEGTDVEEYAEEEPEEAEKEADEADRRGASEI